MVFKGTLCELWLWVHGAGGPVRGTEGREGGSEGEQQAVALPPDQPRFCSVFTRYSILPHSDVERCFSIEPEDGTIRTAVPLDREARVWHNLTVLATELGEESWAPRRPWRRQQPPGRGTVPERGGGEGRGLPSDPPPCTGSPVWITTIRQACSPRLVGLLGHSPDLKFTPVPDFSHLQSKCNLK